MSESLFRPSSLHRRKACPGSMALESSIPAAPESDANIDQAEGRLMHSLIADPTLSRNGITPEQHDIILLAEKLEEEFLNIVRNDQTRTS